VTVSGMVDPDTIIKKLNKAGKPVELWGSKAGMANQFQKLHLDGSTADADEGTEDATVYGREDAVRGGGNVSQHRYSFLFNPV
jgi:hypothetical protein